MTHLGLGNHSRSAGVSRTCLRGPRRFAHRNQDRPVSGPDSPRARIHRRPAESGAGSLELRCMAERAPPRAARARCEPLFTCPVICSCLIIASLLACPSLSPSRRDVRVLTVR
jgi:hypothetical protein